MNTSLLADSALAPAIEALGWTLLHFVWQGAALALLLWVFLLTARKAAPQIRYLAACAALAVMFAAAVSTFCWQLSRSQPAPSALPADALVVVPVPIADSHAAESVPHEPADTDAALAEGHVRVVMTTSATDLPGSAVARSSSVAVLDEPKSNAASPLTPQPSSSKSWSQRIEPWLPWIVCLWAVGVAYLSLRLLAGWNAVRSLRATSVAFADDVWLARFARLKARLGITGPVRLLTSTRAVVPMVIGWLKPVVLIPAELVTGLSAEQLEAILAHELIHIRRHDYLVNLLQNVLETLFFYHPAVAWLSRRVRVEREHCCDDAASLACGGTLDYARALAALAEFRRAPSFGVAASGGSLVERIRRLATAGGAESRRGAPTPLPTMLLLLSALCALATIAGATLAQQRSAPVTNAQTAVANDDKKLLPAKEEHGDLLTVRGQVLSPDGRPVAGARVEVLGLIKSGIQARTSDTRPGAAHVNRFADDFHHVWSRLAASKSDPSGKFEISYRKSQFTEAMVSTWNVATIAVVADGFGVQWTSWGSIEPSKPLALKVVPDVPIRGRVIDLEGKPVAGADVEILQANGPSSGATLESWLDAIKSGRSVGTTSGHLASIVPVLHDARLPVKTNAQGEFRIAGIGGEHVVRLRLRGDTIARAELIVATRRMGPVTSGLYSMGDGDPIPVRVLGSDFTFSAPPTQPLVGTVRDAATGKPLARVAIESGNLSRRMGDVLRTETDADGHYRLAGLPKSDHNGRRGGNRLFILPNIDQPYFMRQVRVPAAAGLQPITVDVELHRGIWIEGRVTDKATGQPLLADVNYWPFLSNPFARKFPEFHGTAMEGDSYSYPYTTRPDGSFRLPGLPGRAIAGVRAQWQEGQSYCYGIGASEIGDLAGDGEFRTYRNPTAANPKTEHALKEINPPEGADSVRCDFVLDRGETIRVTTVDRDGKPVPLANCFIIGDSNGGRSRPLAGSTIDVSNLTPNETRSVVIYDGKRDVGKIFTFKYDQKTPRAMTVVLEPCATVKGRFLDEDGVPFKKLQIHAEANPRLQIGWAASGAPLQDANCGADGRFAYTRLLPGRDYTLRTMGPEIGAALVAEKIAIEPGKTIDLGDIKLKRHRSETSQNDTRSPAKEEHGDTVTIRGRVLRPDGQPATAATVSAVRLDWKGGERSSWDLVRSSASTGTGEFEMNVRRSEWAPALSLVIAAQAKGFGIEWRYWSETERSKPLVLKLARDYPIHGRVLTLEGKPVAGVTARVLSIDASGEAGLRPWLEAVQAGVEPWVAARKLGLLIRGFPGRAGGVAVSDTDGRFTLTGLGAERVVDLGLQGETIAYRRVTVATREMQPIVRSQNMAAGSPGANIQGATFTHLAGPTRPIIGVVRDASTGTPLAGVHVESARFADGWFGNQRDLWTTSDADGHFRLIGMSRGKGNMLLAVPADDQPYFMRYVDVPPSEGVAPVTVNIGLHRGLFATGRVIDNDTRAPVYSEIEYWPFRNNPYAKSLPEFSSNESILRIQGQYHTRSDGSYRIPVLPGRGIVGAQSYGGSYRQGSGAQKIGDWDAEGRFRTYGYPGPSLKWPTGLQEINPAESTTAVKCDFAFDHGATFRVTVLDPEGKPLNGCTTSRTTTDGKFNGVNSPFELNNLRPGQREHLLIEHAERGLGKVIRIYPRADLVDDLTVKLEPTMTLIGRLVDQDGIPYHGVTLEAYLVHALDFAPTFPAVTCRPDGTFKYPGLAVGDTYGFRFSGSEIEFGQWPLKRITVQPGKALDVGDIKLTRAGAKTASNDPPSVAPATDKAPDRHNNKSDDLTVHGQVLLPDGKPAVGAKVFALRDSLIAGVKRKPGATTTAGPDGSFELRIPAVPANDPRGSGIASVAAQAPGYGLEGIPLWNRAIDPSHPLVIKLSPEFPIYGRVVDLEGRPIEGVAIRILDVLGPRPGKNLQGWLDAVKDGQTINTQNGELGWMLPGFDDESRPPTKTDRDGRFTLSGIAAERDVRLELRGDAIAYQQIDVATRDMKPVPRQLWDRPVIKDQVYGANFTFGAPPTRPLVGTVRDAVTGKPLAGVTIESSRLAGLMVDPHNVLRTQSDAQGHYRLVGLPKSVGPASMDRNEIMILPGDQPDLVRRLEVPDAPGAAPIPFDIELHRGIWITGRVTDRVTGKPISAKVQYFPERSNAAAARLPEYGRPIAGIRDDGHTSTAPDGTYRLVGLPGRGIVGITESGAAHRTGVGASEISGIDNDGTLPTLRRSYAANAKRLNALKEINPAAGAESVQCDFVLDPGGSLQLKLVDPAAKPVEFCFVYDHRDGMTVQRQASSPFELVGMAPNESRPMLIIDQQRKLGKLLTVKYDEKGPHELTVTLELCGTVKGRLLDEEGAPLKGLTVSAMPVGNLRHVAWIYMSATSDLTGRFVYDTVVPGSESYSLGISRGGGHIPTTVVENFAISAGRTIDLGDIKLKKRGSEMTKADEPRPARFRTHQGTTSTSTRGRRPAVRSIRVSADHTAKASAKEQPSDTVTIRGQVLRPDGQPAAGARVTVRRNYWTSSVKWRPLAAAIADALGRFELSYRPSQFADELGTSAEYSQVAAQAEGFGADWVSLPEAASKPLILKLVPDRPIQGRVVDLEGKPVEGVRVRLLQLRAPKDGQDLGPWLEAIKLGAMKNALSQKLGKTLPGCDDDSEPPVVTDRDGRFTLRGVGAERDVQIELRGETIAYWQLDVATRDMKPLTRKLWFYAGLDRPPLTDQVFGADFTVQAAPTRPIVGTVRDRASGKPLAGVLIESEHLAGMLVYPHDVLRTQTDADGRFRLLGMPKGGGADMAGRNEISILPNDEQPYFIRQMEVPDSPGLGPVKLDIDLLRGQWITGRVIDKATGKPVFARVRYFPSRTNPHVRPPEFHPNRIDFSQQERFHTRPDGSFRILGLPGSAIVGVWAVGGLYRNGVGASEIAGINKNGDFPGYVNEPSSRLLHALNAVNLREGVQSPSCDFVLDDGDSIQISVVDLAGKPVTGASVLVEGGSGGGEHLASTFEVPNLAFHDKREISILHRERQIGKHLDLTYDEKTPHKITVTLEPCATLVGRLVDADGTPFAGVEVQARPHRGGYPWPFIPLVVSKADGRFECRSLFPGCDYGLAAHGTEVKFQVLKRGIVIEPGKTLDLGDIKLKRRMTQSAAIDQSEPPAKKAERDDTLKIRGRVLRPDGKPLAGARLLWLRTRGPHAQAYQNFQWVLGGTSDASGKFELSLSRADFSPQWPTTQVAAVADGFGIDWADLKTDALPHEVTLRLAEDVPVRGRVLDGEGRPVAGAKISVSYLFGTASGNLDKMLSAWSSVADEAIEPMEKKLRIPDAGGPFPATQTDQDGRFEVRGLGRERLAGVGVTAPSLTQTQMNVVLRKGFDPKPLNETVNRRWADMFMRGKPTVLFGPEYDFVGELGRIVQGTVREAGTGRPVAGALVRGNGGYPGLIGSTTDADGRYRLEGMTVLKRRYELMVDAPEGSALLNYASSIANPAGAKPLTVDIELARGVVVTGHVIDRDTKRPLAATLRVVPLADNKYATLSRYRRSELETFEETSADGTFRLVTVPGPVMLLAHVRVEPGNDGTAVDPFLAAELSSEDRKRIVSDQFGRFGSTGGSIASFDHDHAAKVLDLDERHPTAERDLFVERGKTAEVRIEDADGKPLAGAVVSGMTAVPPSAFQMKDAHCMIYGLDPAKPRQVLFYHPRRELAGSLVVRGDETQPLVVRLAPTQRLRGRAINANGIPLDGAIINVFFKAGPAASDLYTYLRLRDPQPRTHDDGAFELTGFMPGLPFELSFKKNQVEFGPVQTESLRQKVSSAAGKDVRQIVDLGEVRVRRTN